jgi:hypothetical protein
VELDALGPPREHEQAGGEDDQLPVDGVLGGDVVVEARQPLDQALVGVGHRDHAAARQHVEQPAVAEQVPDAALDHQRHERGGRREIRERERRGQAAIAGIRFGMGRHPAVFYSIGVPEVNSRVATPGARTGPRRGRR